MREFDSIEAFTNFLDSTIQMRVKAIPALEFAAQVVEKAAKAELGTYQKTNMGSFKAWRKLSDVTIADRRRLKSTYGENAPLLREGVLRDSISHQTDKSGLEAVIGSSLEKAIYLELGTKKMPPRSFLGLAAHRSKKKIIKLVGGVTVCALLNWDYTVANTKTASEMVFNYSGE